VKARDELVAALHRSDDHRHEHAAQPNRLRQVLDMFLVVSRTLSPTMDVVEHETQLPGVGSRGGAHEGLLGLVG